MSYPSSETENAVSKAHTALHALSKILPSPPPTSLSSATDLLHDTTVFTSISSLLRRPESGSGDNPLCRFLYDAFQSDDPGLRLLVLSHVPLISGLYLTRVASTRLRLSGFEALLMALYVHETASRPYRTAAIVNLPKLSNPSIYHEPATPTTTAQSTDLHVGVLSHALEPHTTLRATCRARVVGVALEMYHEKIRFMPERSKVEFCESCEGWGRDGGLPWEVMQPAVRILGHCLNGPGRELLHEEARGACRSLYARALHGIDANAVLATQSLIRMMDVEIDQEKDVDYTDLPRTRVISI